MSPPFRKHGVARRQRCTGGEGIHPPGHWQCPHTSAGSVTLYVPSSFSLSPWFSFSLSPWSSFSLPPWFSVPLFSFLLYSPLTLCSFCSLNNKVDVVLESSSVDILYMRRKQSSYSCLNIWASVFSFLRQPNIHHNNKDFLTPRGNFTIVLTSLTPTCACSVLFWLKVVTLGCVVFTVEM